MEAGGFLQYAQDYGVFAALFVGLLAVGIPWLLKREKLHNAEKSTIFEERLKELKESQSTTQQMALTFNDTVNKFNNTIEGHTDQMKLHSVQMQAHTEQIGKISVSVNSLVHSVTMLVDNQAVAQSNHRQLEVENRELRNRVEKSVRLMEEVNKKLNNQ